MEKTVLNTDDKDCWHISGELDFATVAALLDEIRTSRGRQGLPGAIDLKAVSRTDSAGLAFLIELLRDAKRNGQNLNFQNLPPQLLHIAEISGLEVLFNTA